MTFVVGFSLSWDDHSRIASGRLQKIFRIEIVSSDSSARSLPRDKPYGGNVRRVRQDSASRGGVGRETAGLRMDVPLPAMPHDVIVVPLGSKVGRR